MQAPAEGEVADVVAVDVERGGVGMSARVTVRRSEQQQHRTAGRHCDPVALEIPCAVTGDMRPRRLEPQRLVDRAQQQ